MTPAYVQHKKPSGNIPVCLQKDIFFSRDYFFEIHCSSFETNILVLFVFYYVRILFLFFEVIYKKHALEGRAFCCVTYLRFSEAIRLLYCILRSFPFRRIVLRRSSDIHTDHRSYPAQNCIHECIRIQGK